MMGTPCHWTEGLIRGVRLVTKALGLTEMLVDKKVERAHSRRHGTMRRLL